MLGVGVGITDLAVLGTRFDPRSLFASGEAGALYQISPSTTFTDTARTTPAQVGQAVAAVTDQSGRGNHLTQATAASRPILREETRTNKCTNYNANPTDLTNVSATAGVLSVVDDTAALAAAGLSSICTSGKVYKLDNSAGGTTAHAIIGGAAGNTRQHTGSVYARAASGTANIRFDTGAVYASTTSAAYSRLTGTKTASATDQVYVSALAGSVIYFILNQLEESAAASSPVVTTGAAASVNMGYYYLEFDGVDDFLRATFAIAQPWDRISAIRQTSWTLADEILGGVVTNAGILYQRVDTPNIGIYSGASFEVFPDLLIGTTGVVTERHNGASSRIATNSNAPVTGNAGTNLPGGLTLGASNRGDSFSNIRLYSLLMIGRALSDAETVLARRAIGARAGVSL